MQENAIENVILSGKCQPSCMSWHQCVKEKTDHIITTSHCNFKSMGYSKVKRHNPKLMFTRIVKNWKLTGIFSSSFVTGTENFDGPFFYAHIWKLSGHFWKFVSKAHWATESFPSAACTVVITSHHYISSAPVHQNNTSRPHDAYIHLG